MSDRPNTSLLFVEMPGPAASKDRERSRAARSHAVSVALARQRHKARQQGKNFRVTTAGKGKSHQLADMTDATALEATIPSGYVGAASVDPFETLPINARRLTNLLYSRRSMFAGEPVFNTDGAVHYQRLYSVFRTGLTDGALTAALGLTMCYAVNGGVFDHECVTLNSIALQQVRKKVSDPTLAATPATIGSILLLLGIEYRLGARQRAQSHLEGIRALLQLCNRQKVTLPGPLRRAIYWQDLFSSIFLQTSRIVHYSDFHPGEHAPKLCLRSSRRVPDGFANRASRLGFQFIQIVSDVAALYHCRKDVLKLNCQAEGMERVCNTQAYLEGRLHELRQSTADNLLISCSIAVFLCVYGFWTDVWKSPLIPRGLSTQLLYHVRCWQEMSLQDDDDDLLLWLVHIGKAFAIDSPVRHGLDELRRHKPEVMKDLPIGGVQTETILYGFIWSDIFYQPEMGWFWEQINEGR